MKIGYFTERPYRWVPEDEVLKNHAFFALSNSHFDRDKAADDYNYYTLPPGLQLERCDQDAGSTSRRKLARRQPRETTPSAI